MPKFSICMTNYNTVNVLQRSLDSIISRIDPVDFEIIIVDNISNDGSLNILKEYADKNLNLKLIIKKCLRGEGRQIAFRKSTGNIIITADCDTIYSDDWKKLINYYYENKLNYALSTWYCQIYPRHILEEVGGWKNLQYNEDAELWARIAQIGKYHTYPMVSGENIKQNPSQTILERYYRIYRRMQDKMIVFRVIPTNLFFSGYLKVIKQKHSGLSRIYRILFYYSCLTMALFSSTIRKKIHKYGDISFLNKKGVMIDLGIVDKCKLDIQEEIYDTPEMVKNAYINGNLHFLAGFYD